MSLTNQKPFVLNWHGEVTEEIVREFRNSIEEAVTRIATDAKKNTHKFSDTGNLAARIFWGVERQGAKLVGKVWTATASGRRQETTITPGGSRTVNQGYALWVEIGTGIYGARKQPIKPKRARFLVWRDRKTGKIIVARQVRGRPATPFFRPAIAANKDFVKEALKETARRLE